MCILMFPGQGVQAKGMGKALFDKFPDLTCRASEILGYDARELCLADPEKKLGLTQYTQPALFLVHALAWYDAKEDANLVPKFALGHSLGEYNALLAAGVFEFEAGLKLVQERGRLMGEASGGGMAAVMGVSPHRIRQILDENQLTEVDLANFNTPSQTVIAGPKDTLTQAVKVLKTHRIRVVALRVSAPFHSRYMAGAADAFAEFLNAFGFHSPKFPVMANATARPYGRDNAAQLLARQMAGPVKWAESIRYLMGAAPELAYKEMNGRVLTKMVAQIKKECSPLCPEEMDAGTEGL